MGKMIYEKEDLVILQLRNEDTVAPRDGIPYS